MAAPWFTVSPVRTYSASRSPQRLAVGPPTPLCILTSLYDSALPVQPHVDFHAHPVPVFGSCAAVAGSADAHCSLLRTRRVSPGGHDFSLCRHAYGWEPRRFFSQPRRGHGPNEASAPSAIAQENKSDPTRSSSCPSPPSTDCGVCTILPLHTLQELFLGSEIPSKNLIRQRQTL